MKLAALLALLLLPSAASAQTAAGLEALRRMGIKLDDGAAPARPAAAGAPLPVDADLVVASTLRAMTFGMTPERRAAVLARVVVHVVPRGRPNGAAGEAVIRETEPATAAVRIADLRASYAERLKEPPGRSSREPRGMTDDFGGKMRCFVGEENVTAPAGGWDANGSRAQRVLVHELGHAVMRLSMSGAEVKESQALAEKQGSDMGGGEYFAVATEAWFGVHQKALNVAGEDAAYIRARLPKLAALLERVYGPAPR